MSEHSDASSNSPIAPIFALEDRPRPLTALTAGVQHLLAAFVNIIAPALIIGAALDLTAHIPFLISASLLVSGMATWIQSQRLGSIGSGLLSIQGTSFAFVAALVTAGTIARERGAGDEEVLAILFGVGAVGSFIEIAIAYFLPWLKRVINPITAGTIVVLIGLSLISSAVRDVGGGADATNFGSLSNVLLAGVTIAVVVACQFLPNLTFRIGSIFFGLVAGCTVALFTGQLSSPDFSNATLVSVPMPLAYGLSFDWVVFIPIAFMFVVTSLETVGDITGTSRVSGEPVSGPLFEKRVRGGVLADGINSLLAAFMSTFPNTTFSQNTGVVQLTGVASRHVGKYVAGLLILLGLFPAVGIVLQGIPRPVLGATVFIMFSLIAVSGIQILGSQRLNRGQALGVALAIGAGMGVELRPDVLSFLPDLWQRIFSSGITTGGVIAIIFGFITAPKRGHDIAETETAMHATGNA
jgi:xanthine permease XanP